MISRSKRLSLERFDANWKDSYVIVRPYAFQRIKQIQLDMAVAQRKMLKLERKLQKISRKLNASVSLDKNLEELEAQEETLQEEVIKAAQGIFKITIKIVKDAFVSGSIYDNDKQQNRDMAKGDIDDFDDEILQYVIGALIDTVDKKK